LPWSTAIKKITSRPADQLKLAGRGRIAVNAAADIVVFDPETIGSRATYENPYVAADGVNYVIVNGQVAFSARGEAVRTAGRVLR
jgi:N-acyl-D-amino-acid deacylase